jgi:hypothetical protein
MLSLLTLQAELPEHLTPRVTHESVLLLALFVLCIFLVAVARFREKLVFLYLLQAVFFLKPLDDLSKEAYKAQSTASVLFILQFLLITSGAIYWHVFYWHTFEHTFLHSLDSALILLAVPGIYFIYQFLVTNLAARLAGNASVVNELNYFTLLLTQFFGLLFLVELFVSYFQPQYDKESMWLLSGTYIAYLLIRLLRGFWIVLGHGVKWYYIILYFWTLEILPLLVVARLLYY